MGVLQSALDALAAEDLDTLPAGAQLDRIRNLVAAQNRVAALLTRAVRTADLTQAVEHDGLTSIKSWLRTHTRLPDAAVRRLVESGRALETLPPWRRCSMPGRSAPRRSAPSHRSRPRTG